ncbi:MAG TPA: nucleotide exchange factor GrpE [Termitinemataceae bacterium]|nr:nucleotide exchange factor GrpE [Termitinemataceae bacterium]HOM23147.1 nucleotide exchange factor GrpE [Termitinemataceae bacterium]HPQ00330.1 nucleotide exchange factor GrpE [Termitinemataceae bacterium]
MSKQHHHEQRIENQEGQSFPSKENEKKTEQRASEEQKQEKVVHGEEDGSSKSIDGPQQERGDQSTSAEKEEELKAKVASLQAEVEALRDQYLRKVADFENFRKRMQREKQKAIEFANQSLLLDLIPVIDDFERAIRSSEASRDYGTLHEGISMIEKSLISMLENKWGLKRFESRGEPFDPNRHEAIMIEEDPTIPEPVVGEDLIKGYLLKDRIIRTAKVKVLMPKASNQGAGTATPNGAMAQNAAGTPSMGSL